MNPFGFPAGFYLLSKMRYFSFYLNNYRLYNGEFYKYDKTSIFNKNLI